MKPRSSWARILVGVLAVAFCFAMAAPPAVAGQLPSPKPISSNTAPLAASAAARVEAMTPAQVLATTQASPAAPTTSSPSFFKTPKGIAALVLIVAGAGYVAYAAVDDRKPVKSPIR